MTEKEKKAIEILKKRLYEYEVIDFYVQVKLDNAIQTILPLIEKQAKEIEELKRQIQIKNNYMKLILDILYDYDGYFSRQTNEGNAKDLADLIDETCDYLKKAILNDDKSDVYESYVDMKKKEYF